MRVQTPLLVLSALFVVFTAACAAKDEPAEPAPEINGPALIMFYTDN